MQTRTSPYFRRRTTYMIQSNSANLSWVHFKVQAENDFVFHRQHNSRQQAAAFPTRQPDRSDYDCTYVSIFNQNFAIRSGSDPRSIKHDCNHHSSHYCRKTENELARLKNVYQLQLSDSTVIVAVGFPTVQRENRLDFFLSFLWRLSSGKQPFYLSFFLKCHIFAVQEHFRSYDHNRLRKQDKVPFQLQVMECRCLPKEELLWAVNSNHGIKKL